MRPDGGFTFAEQPDRCGEAARILWRADCDATVLPVSASRAGRSDPAVFDLACIGHPVYIFRDATGIEHLLIGDAAHHLRLDVAEGSVLDGPVRLRYPLADDHTLPAKILALRRLLALERLGRFPRLLFPPDPYAARWARAMQAFDGRRLGATHREIAAVLYGDALVDAEWRGRSDYLRCRVQRALRVAGMLVNGGYRRLLR